MYNDFIQDAIESADNYYTSADKKKHSRVEICVTGIQKIASDLYLLSLSQRLKHSESACLCIESHLVNQEWYDDPDNRFISSTYFKILSVGDEKATATIEIKEGLLSVFDHLCAGDIKIISDLKFLITNVKKWYGKYGHFIHCPPPPALSENDFFWQGTESDQQKDAVRTALTQNISYVWGAPGTGKTQIVLADCILSYIKTEKQVLVLAPTNNAIEQTLRAIIRALENQEQDINCLYRLGTASESFAQQYGSICERIDVQEKIELLQQRLEGMREQKTREDQAKNMLSCYEQLKDAAAVYHHYAAFQENLTATCAKLKERIDQISQEVSRFKRTVSDIHSRTEQISNREKSPSFKIKRWFTKAEEKSLHMERENLELRLSHARSHLAELENEQAAAHHALADTEEQHLRAKEAKHKAYFQAKEISQPILHLGIFTVEAACAHFEKIIAQYASFRFDPSLSEKISKKEDALRRITETATQTIEGKLVFAFTVDYFFAHYKSLAEVGINSALVSHIFLDEAAYCPLIKSGILYSLDAPVTLLGDHMQLPPICEASDRATADPTTKLFLWDMSAIYLPELFDCNASLATMFERYKTLRSRSKKDVELLTALSEENLSVAILPYTFRFGHNLAQLLDEFVYKTGFSGRKDFDTDITVIHAKKHAGENELRANVGEAAAIKRYITLYAPKNYVIMTPYKKQRTLLMDTLRGITDPDNILTIHASQGREWDTVILSATDSQNPFLVNSSLPQGLHALNTAISRAKKNIVIVCDCDYWSNHSESQLIGKLSAIATHTIIS